MGRFDRERWTRGWQGLFATYRLVHNRREIVVTDEADGGFAVVEFAGVLRTQRRHSRPRLRGVELQRESISAAGTISYMGPRFRGADAATAHIGKQGTKK